jgi:hypothetical protein
VQSPWRVAVHVARLARDSWPVTVQVRCNNLRMTETRSGVSNRWWELPAVRVFELIGIVVAIATSVGSLSVSGLTYRSQQEQIRSESARAVVLLPGTKDAVLQNFGELPVFNVSIHVGDSPGVMLGVLPPCHEIDVSKYGELREIEDRDGDGVGESAVGTVIQFWDARGRLWQRTGVFGYSTIFNTSLSAPKETHVILAAAVPTPPALPRKMGVC